MPRAPHRPPASHNREQRRREDYRPAPTDGRLADKGEGQRTVHVMAQARRRQLPTEFSAAHVAERCAESWKAATQSSPYADSPFRPLWEMSSRRKGAHMEATLHTLLEESGYEVLRGGSSEFDRTVNGLKLEIKGSFLWDGAHQRFSWQQIRLDQDYDLLALLAFYPDRLLILGATKQQVTEHLGVQDAEGRWPYNQHGGSSVNSGAFVMNGLPEDFPWLRSLGDLLPKK